MEEYSIEIWAQVDEAGVIQDTPDWLKLEYQHTYTELDIDGHSAALFILTFGRDLGVGLIASALYDLIKKHARKNTRKVKIDRKVIELKKGEIQKVIEEHIRSEED